VSDDTFSTTLRIAASPAEVFPYLTEPELMVRWMGDFADLQPTPGGVFIVDINGVPIRGHYVVVDPPNRVVFTWGASGSAALPPGSTTVEITLRSEGSETVLELAHRQLPPDEVPQHGVGWGHFLDRLAAVAAGDDPGPDPWASQ
jgi:uncharacterized protein YndB with AHSA1/START domain